MGKSLFIYVNDTWKECTPYLNVGSTWKRVLEFNAKTAEVWKPEKHVHVPETIAAIPPTCTTIGYTSGKKCAECDEFLIEPQPIPSLGHQWTDWEITIYPTETSEGEQQRSCTGCFETETVPVQKLNHTHNYILTPAKSATCTETGNKAYYYCDGCQTYFDNQKQITTWSALEIAEDPTAHTGTLGYVGTQSTHSSYSCCGATTSAHSYTVNSGIKAFDASCTSPQYNFKRCVCGYNPRSTSHIVSTGTELGHDLSVPTDCVTVPATCTTAALHFAKCSRSGCDYESSRTEDGIRVGEPLGHDYSSKYIGSAYFCSAANCQSASTYYYKCSRCTASSKGDTNTTFTDGAKNTSNHVSGCTFTPTKKAGQCGKYTKCGTIVTGHTYDVTANIYEPESETTHTVYRECKMCGYRNYGDSANCVFTVVTDPTCAAAGLKKCSVCKQEISIPATGHSLKTGSQMVNGQLKQYDYCTICDYRSSYY